MYLVNILLSMIRMMFYDGSLLTDYAGNDF